MMTNYERLKEQLKEFLNENEIDSLAITKKGEIQKCSKIRCGDCIACDSTNGCDCFKLFAFLASEYKEPVKLTRYEYETLKYAEKEVYEWIARDKNGVVYFYTDKPVKQTATWDSVRQMSTFFGRLFNFVKWEDEEPTKIKDILNNCEIIEESEKK